MNTASMSFTVAPDKTRNVTITFDEESFERIAAIFGYLSEECVASIGRAERDVRAGRVRESAKGARF